MWWILENVSKSIFLMAVQRLRNKMHLYMFYIFFECVYNQIEIKLKLISHFIFYQYHTLMWRVEREKMDIVGTQ